MRAGFWSSLGSLLAGAAVSMAQPLGTLSIPNTTEPIALAALVQAEPPAVQPGKPVPETAPPTPTDASPVLAGLDYAPTGNGSPGQRFWASGEYLLWWIKSGPLPVPLVTSGNPTDARPGALGSAGTQVLLGGSDMDYGSFSGGRLTLGGWLDAEGTVGIEASGFLLESKSVTFTAPSNLQGNPTLAIPFRDTAGTERGLLVNFPASTIPGFVFVRVGGVAFSSSSQLWGAELNGLVNLARQTNYSFDLVAGIRYVDLNENLRLSAISEATGQVFDPSASRLSVATTDSFETRNQFYGAQVGGRFGYRFGAWSLNVAGKIALGATQQVVDISGVQAAAIGTGFIQVAPPVVAGGIFAQPSNSGRRTHDQFSVVPEVQVALRYDITPRLRTSVGYNFLYWNNVVRPGDQLNRVINAGTINGSGRDVLNVGFANRVQPGTPAPLFKTSDVWAHGLTFSLELGF